MTSGPEGSAVRLRPSVSSRGRDFLLSAVPALVLTAALAAPGGGKTRQAAAAARASGAVYAVGAASAATAGVADDETAALVLRIDRARLAEATSDAATLTVAVTNGVTFQETQEIDISLAGSATAGSDFTFVDAKGGTFTRPYVLKLPAGAGAVTATVRAVNDVRDEPAETIAIAAAHGGRAIGPPQTLTIADDDPPPVLQLEELVVRGNGGRSLYPAFDPDTLHYALGCSDEDLLVFALSARGRDTRLAVDGRQAGHRYVVIDVAGLGGNRDIEIVLSDGSGRSRRYTVHCLPDDYPNISVVKRPGAWDGLILGSVAMGSGDGPGRWSFLQIMDTNGVPWFHRRISGRRVTHFRPQTQGRYPFGYLVAAGNDAPAYLQLLDADLENAFRVSDEGLAWKRVPSYLDVHDFVNKQNGNVVFATDDGIRHDLSAFTDADGNSFGTRELVEDAVLQAITADGRLEFTWNSWDHLEIGDCTQHNFAGDENPDYSHFNSIELVDGHYLVSFKGCSKVVMIDGTTGEVLWRVGRSNRSDEEWREKGRNPPLAIAGDPYGEFCGQHSAKIIGNGHLLLYDNGNECLEDPRDGSTARASDEVSRVVEYALDTAGGEAVFVRHHSLYGEFDIFTRTTGLVAPADNGNWWISWGRATGNAQPDQSITEVNPETGEEVLHVLYTDDRNRRRPSRSYPLRYDQLAALAAPGPLAAETAHGTSTSTFHRGATDSPTVVVAFSRPVVDFAAGTPSVEVAGATVGDVVPHVVAGDPANAYRFTLVPAGDGPVSFRLVADRPCGSGGICARDGTRLSDVPAEHFIRAGAPPNRPPEAAGPLVDRTLEAGARPLVAELAESFRDPDGDVLTYAASTSAPAIVAVAVTGSGVALAPLAQGVATITVTATDVGGSHASATQAFTVTVACSFAVSPTHRDVLWTADTGRVRVDTAPDCAWTASSEAAFLTVTGGAGGTGPGTAAYAVAPNRGAPRSGALTVAGRRITFYQASPNRFTDHPLRSGKTPIRAIHFLELRGRIDLLRAGAELDVFGWTDRELTAGVTRVRQIHLAELRAALMEAYLAAGRPAPTWAARVTAGESPIRAAHLMELRRVVGALE